MNHALLNYDLPRYRIVSCGVLESLDTLYRWWWCEPRRKWLRSWLIGWLARKPIENSRKQEGCSSDCWVVLNQSPNFPVSLRILRFRYVFDPKRPPCLHWRPSPFSTPPRSSWSPGSGRESVISKDVRPASHHFTPLIDFPPIYCLHAMSDGRYGCGMLVVAWHRILWCTWCSSEPADGFFFNRASTFSCNSKVCNRFHETGLVTTLFPCICSLVIAIWQTCCTVMCHIYVKTILNIPKQHFCLLIDSVYVGHIFGPSTLHISSSLQISSLLIALIISTWHHMRRFKHALKCFSIWDVQALEIRNEHSRTKPQDLSIEGSGTTTRNTLGHMLPAQLSLKFESESSEWLLMCWQFWPVPHDPRCIYGGMANGLHLVLSNLLLTAFGQEFSALPGLGFRQRDFKTS